MHGTPTNYAEYAKSAYKVFDRHPYEFKWYTDTEFASIAKNVRGGVSDIIYLCIHLDYWTTCFIISFLERYKDVSKMEFRRCCPFCLCNEPKTIRVSIIRRVRFVMGWEEREGGGRGRQRRKTDCKYTVSATQAPINSVRKWDKGFRFYINGGVHVYSQLLYKLAIKLVQNDNQ